MEAPGSSDWQILSPLPSTHPVVSHRSEGHLKGHGAPFKPMKPPMSSLNGLIFLPLPAVSSSMYFFPAVLLFYKHVPCRLHICSLSLQLQSRSPSRELMPTILTSDFIGCVEYGLKEACTCSFSVVEGIVALGGDSWLRDSTRGR